jgi:hypothetical protein
MGKCGGAVRSYGFEPDITQRRGDLDVFINNMKWLAKEMAK